MQPKKRRLVADTADDLQHILFGDLDETEGGPQAVSVQEVPASIVPRPEADDIDVLSDSDRDSMDEFIVRDTNEDREQRHLQSYADQFGDEATETLGDVVAIFGDLRILDIYSRDVSKLSRISPRKGETSLLEERFDSEEVKEQFATSKDDEILKADWPERMQERLGTETCLQTESKFNSSSPDLEQEWAIEARWIYAVLFDRHTTAEAASKDWTFWSPLTVQDKEDVVLKNGSMDSFNRAIGGHSALSDPSHKSDVVARINAALRDMRGRGFEPLYLWHSMSRCKYDWYLNLSNLMDIRRLDEEWTKTVWPKFLHVKSRTDTLLGELDVIEEKLRGMVPSGDNTGVLESTLESILVEAARGDLHLLQSDLQVHQMDGVTSELSLHLDDFSLSIANEVEPLVKYLSSQGDAARGMSQILVKKVSLVSQILGHNFHQVLIPLITLSPRELGENLSLGGRVHKGPFAGRPPVFEESLVTVPLRSVLVEFLAMTVASNVKVRKWFRQQLWDRLAVFSNGGSTVSASEPLYAIKRLCGRPVRELLGTEIFACMHCMRSEIGLELVQMDGGYVVVEGVWESKELDKLKQATSEGVGELHNRIANSEKYLDQIKSLREVRNREQFRSKFDLATTDKLLADLIYYMQPDTAYRESAFISELRSSVANSVVQNLTKSMKGEVYHQLLKDSERVVAKRCANTFGNMLRSRPFDCTSLVLAESSEDAQVDKELFMRKSCGKFSALGVSIERVANGHRVHLAVVGATGDVLDSIALDHLLGGSMVDKKHYLADQNKVVSLVKSYMPSLVIVGAEDKKSRSLLMELKSVLKYPYHRYATEDRSGNDYEDTEQSKALPSPEVVFGDVSVCSAIAHMSKVGDQSSATAVSLCRMAQSPTAEILALWSDHVEANIALTAVALLPPEYGSLVQRSVPKQLLHDALLDETQTVVADMGVDLNSSAAKSLVRFVPGLGPRKALNIMAKLDADLKGLGGGSTQDDDNNDDEQIEQEAAPKKSDNASVRMQKLEKVLGAKIFLNAQPFFKLAADPNRMYLVKKGLVDDQYDSDEDGESDDDQGEGQAERYNNEYDTGYGNGYDSGATSASLVYKAVGQSHNYLEQCRMAKECWPIVRALFEGGDLKSLWKNLSAESLSSNYEELVEVMFSESANVPAHLVDPELDVAWIKSGAKNFIEFVLVPEILKPWSNCVSQFRSWEQPTKTQLFYAFFKENEMSLNLFSIVHCSVTEVSRGWIKVVEESTNISGWLTTGDTKNWNNPYYVGDAVRCRVKEIDYGKCSMSFTAENLSEKEISDFVKPHSYLLVKSEDFSIYSNLGKVVPESEVSTTRTTAGLKTRRIIKHENYFEISHAGAVEKLAEASIGEVIFRPSQSTPGQYLGLIKCKGLAESRDPAREDWIKVFRFFEGPSSKSRTPKSVFKLLDNPNEEFEEFDQMKVLYVDKYLRNLTDLRNHPKFRPESTEQVKNLVKAKTIAQRGSVAYAITLDERREFGGNALLLWAATSEKIYEDPIEITNKGFKWWTKGPYATVNAFLNWWKQGGYKERSALMDDWINVHKKQ